ncbi:MAG: hypothetical protein N3J91_15405 [Verrucomicrobiae bacterium]|nr:hypothetical protein [Verrucomicrobiae bacterium]
MNFRLDCKPGGPALGGLLALLVVGLGVAGGAAPEDQAAPSSATVWMQPDYGGIIVPPNIAPLNFRLTATGTAYRVVARSTRGASITVEDRQGRIQFPLRAWRALLQENAGKPLIFEPWVRQASGQWTALPPVTNHIAAAPVDEYLAYRRLGPLYNLYARMGLYQRHLGSFEEKEIMENSRINGSCLNCHTFLNHSPERMFFHLRAVPGNPILLRDGPELKQIARTAGYSSWHPSGRLIVYSVNKLSLFFHTRGNTRDVYDADSDLNVYRLDDNTVEAPPPIALTNRLETWPCWSPDGRFLYYSSAPPLPQERFREIRYDLMRVAYDIEKNRWGEPELVVSGREANLSATQPRVSPDGRWLLFTASRYGNFPVYQAGADLCLIDLATRQIRAPEINSPQTDSWHCWSSNSRWIVFSSKRRDGVFSFPYLAYVDEEGQFSKPFILPQEDPGYYAITLKNFNIPEFIKTPVNVAPADLARAVLQPAKKIEPVLDPVHPPSGRQGTRGAAQ